MKELTSLEKVLMVISAHGIWIEHKDGHRWIECNPEPELTNFDEDLREAGVLLNNKIYGGVYEAIYVLNEAWKRVYGMSIVAEFEKYWEKEWDVELYKTDHKRITLVEEGKGGLV
jgi:hypothetical protein